MKESIAITKTCPYLMQSSTISAMLAKMFGNPTLDEITTIVSTGLCNGSGCAMWEVYDKSEDNTILYGKCRLIK